jgi:hypothetical protein
MQARKPYCWEMMVSISSQSLAPSVKLLARASLDGTRLNVTLVIDIEPQGLERPTCDCDKNLCISLTNMDNDRASNDLP